MSPSIKTSRERWIAEGLRALGDGGPDQVRVDRLAREIGVTKGGFYGHFADRDALLEAMLDSWEQTVVDEVIANADTPHADARERLADLFTVASGNSEWVRIDLAIRDWARRDRRVAKRLARIDDRRFDYMRALFLELGADEADAEAKALLCAALWVGGHFFAAGGKASRRKEIARRAFERIVA